MSEDEVQRLVAEFGEEYTGEASESCLYHWLQQAGGAELWPRFVAVLVERGIWEPPEAREQVLMAERARAGSYRDAAGATIYSIVSKTNRRDLLLYVTLVIAWGLITLRSDVLDTVFNTLMFGPVGFIALVRIWRYLRPLRVAVAGSMLRATRGKKTVVEIPVGSIAYLDVAGAQSEDVLALRGFSRGLSRVGLFAEIYSSMTPKKMVVARLEDGGMVLLSDVVDAASAHGGCVALEKALELVPPTGVLVRVEGTETEDVTVLPPAEDETSVA